jgi:hypothetical protein
MWAPPVAEQVVSLQKTGSTIGDGKILLMKTAVEENDMGDDPQGQLPSTRQFAPILALLGLYFTFALLSANSSASATSKI